MKKRLLIILLVVSGFVKAQSDLNFETPFYEAVNNWVAFPNDDHENAYFFGFIFLDIYNGFTLKLEGKFENTPEGLKQIPGERIRGFVIHRLDTNTAPVAVLTSSQLKELKLLKEPAWFMDFKKDTNDISYLKSLGFHLNQLEEFEAAIDPLEKAYLKKPHEEGLEIELAKAYNALKQHEKALKVLEKAIENNPENYLFYKEKAKAYLEKEEFQKAEENFKKGIKKTNRSAEKSQMSFEMTRIYFERKEKEKFEEWADLTLEYAGEDSRFAQLVEYLKNNWDKKN